MWPLASKMYHCDTQQLTNFVFPKKTLYEIGKAIDQIRQMIPNVYDDKVSQFVFSLINSATGNDLFKKLWQIN